MFYIINSNSQYYAGRCVRGNRTPVWEDHHTRAIDFDDMESAINFAKKENIFWLGIEHIQEE